MARPVSMRIGDRFGLLTVLERAPNVVRGQTRWVCKCDCGQVKTIYATHIRSGETVSCGCFGLALRKAILSTHGMTNSPTYKSWAQMRTRCENPKDASFHMYGGRGVNVCDRWKSFEAFLSDMGERPSLDHSVDRKDTNGNYEPSNCRWATRKEQQRNRRVTIFVTHKGETVPLSSLNDIAAVRPTTLSQRIAYGWTVEAALHTPVRRKPTGHSS